jgi:hypothetical protein
MSVGVEDETRVEAWLLTQGYELSRPKWLPQGKNPDL